MNILVTGGYGFVGSALIRWLMANTDCQIVNLDVLTYAAQPESLGDHVDGSRYTFIETDVCDGDRIDQALMAHQPDLLFHLAAETHVDRSIRCPATFFEANLAGTFTLLEAVRRWHLWLGPSKKARFRFVQVSTDEVYGDLGTDSGTAREDSRWRPSSPYAATKAGADHLVDAWHRTWGLPTIVSHCTNNYGPWQYPEKLIPVVIRHALEGRSIPVYGSGGHVRDWLHVDDHVRALWCLARQGVPGEHYNVAGNCPRRNIDLIRDVCRLLDELSPVTAPDGGHAGLVEYVSDRPGHDWRYALDDGKIRALGWAPEVRLEDGLRATVRFYLSRFMKERG